MSSTAPVLPVETPALSEAERVVDTFVAPTKTFTDLRRSSNWLVPFLLLCVVSIALVTVVDKKLGMEKVVENQLALQPKQANGLINSPPKSALPRCRPSSSSTASSPTPTRCC